MRQTSDPTQPYGTWLYAVVGMSRLARPSAVICWLPHRERIAVCRISSTRSWLLRNIHPVPVWATSSTAGGSTRMSPLHRQLSRVGIRLLLPQGMSIGGTVTLLKFDSVGAAEPVKLQLIGVPLFGRNSSAPFRC